MKKDILFLVLVINLLLIACRSQSIPPTMDANSVAQTAAAVVWTGVAQTKEAEPSATPTLPPEVMTQVAVTEMVGNKNSYQALEYMDLITSEDHLMEKIVLNGTITNIADAHSFYLLTDPNYRSAMALGNVMVYPLLPATDLTVGDVVTVYGVYVSRAFEERTDGEKDFYFIILDSAFYEK